MRDIQEDISTEKDDNFFVQQKSGDTDNVIVRGDEIAPGDSGGTKETTRSTYNTNHSNSNIATINATESFICSKCDKTLSEPPVSGQT